MDRLLSLDRSQIEDLYRVVLLLLFSLLRVLLQQQLLHAQQQELQQQQQDSMRAASAAGQRSGTFREPSRRRKRPPNSLRHLDSSKEGPSFVSLSPYFCLSLIRCLFVSPALCLSSLSIRIPLSPCLLCGCCSVSLSLSLSPWVCSCLIEINQRDSSIKSIPRVMCCKISSVSPG